MKTILISLLMIIVLPGAAAMAQNAPPGFPSQNFGDEGVLLDSSIVDIASIVGELQSMLKKVQILLKSDPSPMDISEISSIMRDISANINEAAAYVDRGHIDPVEKSRFDIKLSTIEMRLNTLRMMLRP